MSAVWSVPGFTEVRELGRGGGGTVMLATDDGTGSNVAIKYLGDELVADEVFRAAFRAEARLLAEIDTPHVVRLFEYVESPVGAAIVMELVPGTSLRSTLAEHGPTDPEAALSVLKGSLLGLGAAHRVGVVHRDYKPENVLVSVAGESKLVDFGVAARSGGAGDGAGTPAYMPPEQWAGGTAGPRGDIYSATATFVECVTGKPPFVARDMATLRTLHEYAPIPEDRLPEPLKSLARRGLAKDPAGRPADASLFLAQLERAAVAGYGEDWEERGRGSLARRVALLALLVPAAGGAAGSTAIGSTLLGIGGRGIRLTVATATAALLVGGLVVTVVLPGSGVSSTDARGSGEPPAAVAVAPPEEIPVVVPDGPTVPADGPAAVREPLAGGPVGGPVIDSGPGGVVAAGPGTLGVPVGVPVGGGDVGSTPDQGGGGGPGGGVPGGGTPVGGGGGGGGTPDDGGAPDDGGTPPPPDPTDEPDGGDGDGDGGEGDGDGGEGDGGEGDSDGDAGDGDGDAGDGDGDAGDGDGDDGGLLQGLLPISVGVDAVVSSGQPSVAADLGVGRSSAPEGGRR